MFNFFISLLSSSIQYYPCTTENIIVIISSSKFAQSVNLFLHRLENNAPFGKSSSKFTRVKYDFINFFCCNLCSQTIVSARRISRFLSQPEIDPNNVAHLQTEGCILSHFLVHYPSVHIIALYI